MEEHSFRQLAAQATRLEQYQQRLSRTTRLQGRNGHNDSRSSSNSGSEGHSSRAKELHKHLQQQRGQQASNEVAALTARPVARATDDGGATEARQWTWQQAEQLQLRRGSYSHSNRGNTAMLARARDSRALHTAQTGAPETSSMMHLENRYSRRRHLHHRR